MAPYADLTREIDTGPRGARIGAFFDLDRTLIAGFSALTFFRDALARGQLTRADFLQTILTATRFQLGDIGFSAFVEGTAGMLRGTPEDEYVEVGERLFRDGLAGNIYPESRALVRAHQRRGHTVAVVSSATPYQVRPFARALGIEHVMCTRLEVKDGRLTGRVERPTCYGEGKARVVRAFARAHGISLRKSYFYTDSHEDLPLLDIVGRPRPINPNATLRSIALARGWPLRRFTSRGTPGPEQILRTALSVASLLPSLAAGLPALLLNGDRRGAVNAAISTWGELGTALAGIELQVAGEQHLWSHRPAVFIFNHQSGIDVLLLSKLLRRDFVGIAKQELRSDPIWGPAFRLAGTVFIDRFNHEKAIEALAPAVEALRRGLSLVIAPEGTRSPTPHLGKFKKGAFHLAMAARVPIVPIVFRNALDVLPKHGIVMRPATVEVVVHPPVSTRGWNKRNLDRHVEAVRALFEETLERRG